MHWVGLLALGAAGVAMAAVMTAGGAAGVQLGLALMLIVLVGTMMTVGAISAARLRRERDRVQAIDELVQLRRWDEAALGLQRLLSQPMRSMAGRIQSLIFLVSVLGQRGRYTDAIAVQDYILKHVRMHEGMMFGLKLGRAMALLHEERLLDADRAITALRRSEGARESGGMALVEIFRDVKTGHAQEAVEMFQSRQKQVREQLGHRAADVYALMARAYDLLENSAEAQRWYARATLLAPVKELNRYPEVRALAQRYTPSVAPAGAP